MNIQIAKSRVHQVINVDSINNEACDFMATHIPFRHITFSAGRNVKDVSISEIEVYTKLFEDSLNEDEHQFVIVEGSSGSGKSHFIRWLYTNLVAKGENEKDEVLLIRRSENTLKGTIKQLLEINAVRNLKNKDVYERLVKANTTISDVKFKEEIFAKFIVEINVSEDECLTTLERKRLVALLNNDLYKSKMMEIDGPIERIFSKISNSGVVNINIVAEFRNEDFIIDTDLFDEMRDSADRNAISIAKKLVLDDLDEELLSRVNAFMNSKVEQVIQSCAGIEPGDFQQIFNEIRQELYKKGKNLILLIEDITSFTGINQALLNALVTEHTGMHSSENMCKLISVVGTTDEYYRTFRDNYKDRVSSKIKIEDGTIGQNKEDLYLFFAKYLNTVSLTFEELEKWRIETGAAEEELPVHVADIPNWEAIDVYGKKLSLYPFTKKSIDNLYEYMEVHKTPRYILLDIIKPAIDELIADKSIFMSFLKSHNKPNKGETASRINRVVEELSVDNKEFYIERALTFIGFWGDGTLTKKNNKKIAGITRDVFDEFGFADLWEPLMKTIDETLDLGTDTEQGPISDPLPKKYPKFERFSKILDNWYYKKAIFVEPRYIKEELSDFIYNTINWQQYGIPNNRFKMIRESGYASSIVSFERQEKAADKGLIQLDDSFETYEVIRAIGQWIYIGNKSWNFEGAYNAIYILTNWLESRKKEIVKIVRDYKTGDCPNYVKIAISGIVYEKILNNQINCTKVEEVTIADIIDLPLKGMNNDQKSDEWKKLIDYCRSDVNKNYFYNIVIDYFTLSQGTKDGGHRFLDYYYLEKVFSDCKRKKFSIIEDMLNKTSYVRENEVADHYNKLMSRIPVLVNKEMDNAQKTVKSIYKIFGYDLSDEINTDDIRELLDDIAEFYKRSEQNGFLANMRQNELDNFNKEAAILARNIMKIREIGDASILEKLLDLSNSRSYCVVKFDDYLNHVRADVDFNYRMLENERDDLIKKGKWKNDDPRFEEKNIIKDACVAAVEEMNGSSTKF